MEDVVQGDDFLIRMQSEVLGVFAFGRFDVPASPCADFGVGDDAFADAEL